MLFVKFYPSTATSPRGLAAGSSLFCSHMWRNDKIHQISISWETQPDKETYQPLLQAFFGESTKGKDIVLNAVLSCTCSIIGFSSSLQKKTYGLPL